mmetsp:Transcript_11881/g.16863  ORF Transcript_11881/g.16863 Transcript_11881/m.16863 type:complete len:207 (+) Transcript_11881:229-849(+)
MGEDNNDLKTHPLESEWVLWEHAGGANKDPNKWKENMKELCSFKTVEGFWQYFNHLPRPSEVFFDGESRKKIGPQQKTIEEYSLFQRGIEPEWGDPQNVVGGEWFCRQYLEPQILDLYWHNLVLGVIGGMIETEAESVHINGARVVDKGRAYPMYRLELWINTRDAGIKERVRTRMVELLTSEQQAGGPSSGNRKTQPKFDWKDHQ